MYIDAIHIAALKRNKCRRHKLGHIEYLIQTYSICSFYSRNWWKI